MSKTSHAHRGFLVRLTAAVAAFALMLVCAGCSSQESTSEGDAATDANLKSYTVVRVDGAPDWSVIEELDIDDAPWGDSYGIRAHAQLCYDDQALYVRMWATEQDVRATYTQDDPCPKCYEDSCLEFFMQPVSGDARYMNWEFNPNCAVGNEIGVQKTGRVGLVAEPDTFNAASARTEEGWEITYQIPWDYIHMFYPGFEPTEGLQVRANFYKCGNLTAHKHYLVWNPVDSDTPNFHVPESFGILVFG